MPFLYKTILYAAQTVVFQNKIENSKSALIRHFVYQAGDQYIIIILLFAGGKTYY